MKNISIWQDTIKEKKYSKLDKDIEVDVLIIGGGMTGISTLYQLRNSKLKVVLVEQNKVGMGVTSRSTGKITYLQSNLLDNIRTNLGEKIGSYYLKSQIYARDEIIKTIKENKMECDLEKVNTYLYTNNKEEINKVKGIEEFLNNNGINTYKENVSLVDSLYTIKVDDCYVFHPIKFLYGLLDKNKYPIYENTSIKKIEKSNNYYKCRTDNNTIKAKWVVIASHYPYFNIPFLFPIKSSLEKSYISASLYKTKPLSLISYNKPVVSIRNYKDCLIYLTNSHLVNKKVDDKNNFNDHLKEINKLQLKADYLWSNIDVMTNDGLPYIGKIDNNMLIGTGYNTWGFTNGFLAGIILSDIIQEKDNKYIKLFNPKRKNMVKLVGIIPDMVNNIEGYINGFIKGDKVCPHLGCKLIYNETEKTWDCPCHGSRFDKEGRCISGPSNKDIKK